LGEMGVVYSEENFVNCVKENNVLAVKLFLKAGMDPNVKDRSAFKIALNKKNKDILQELLKAGGIFFDYKNIEELKFLLEVGADVEIKDELGRTALLYPYDALNIPLSNDLVIILLDAGVDVDAQTAGGMTALMYAVFFDQGDVVESLLEVEADVNMKNRFGYTAIMECKSPEVCNALLAAGADVNAQTETGKSVLTIAIEKKPEQNNYIF